MNKIGIYKYGSCNVHSLINALESLSINYEIFESTSLLKNYKKVILPGVGNMKVIDDKSMKIISEDLKIFSKDGGLIYGICLGLQMMFEFSEESNKKTLGLLNGKTISVVKLLSKNLNVNFNKLLLEDSHLNNNIIEKLFSNISRSARFYFLHSYYCKTSDSKILQIDTKVKENKVPAFFIKDNIVGSQFHPELSGENGLKLLKNFSEIVI